MKRNKTLLLSALLCMPGLAYGDEVPAADCRWTFDDPSNVLAPTNGSAILEPILLDGVQVKTIEEVGITSIDGPKTGNLALRIPANAGFKTTFGLTEDAPDYTLVMDVKVADVSPYNALFSTTLTNDEDADIFISGGTVGVGSLGYSGTVEANVWHRYIFVNRDREFTVYLDGVRLNTKDDDRWIIHKDGFLFFADNDGERIQTDVAEIAYWNKSMDETQLSRIGLADVAPFVNLMTPEVKVSYNLDFSIKMKTNVDVTFTTPEWIEPVDVTPASGTKNYTFRAQPMTEGEERTGTIVISGEGIESVEVPVTQIPDPASDFVQEDGFLQLNTQEDFDKWVALTNDGSLSPYSNVELNTDVTATSTEGCIITNYNGVLNGNFHTITLDMNTNHENLEDGAAFIKVLYGTVENVHFDGTVEGTSKYLATVAQDLQKGSVVQNVHSEVNIVSHVNGDGTHGGIAGRCEGESTLRNIVFAGSISSPENTTNCCGGLVGWMNTTGTIENCLVIADMSGILDAGCNTLGRNQGNIVGKNNYASEAKNETPAGCTIVDSDQLNSGEICFALNGNSFRNPAWFQNLDEDFYPTPNSSRGIIYPAADGYATLFPDNAESLAAFLTNLSDAAAAYLESDDVTMYANTALTEEYAALVAGYAGASDMESITTVYEAEAAKKAQMEASIAAYKEYENVVNGIIAELENRDDLYGETLAFLEEYLNGTLEPGMDERAPFGGFLYIMENRQLSNEEVKAEAERAAELLRLATANSIVPGSDVTSLMTNADMSLPNFEGWNSLITPAGNFHSAQGLADFPVAEAYLTPFNLNQTLEDVPDGVYELQVNAYFRWGSEWTTRDAELIPAVLYLNGFDTPIQNITSDMVSQDEAVDMENCYITNPNNWPCDKTAEIDGKTYYAPDGTEGASYAFRAGRYKQTVYGLVTDGKLTIGLRDDRPSSTEWVCFSNFKLTYQGMNVEVMPTMMENLQKQANAYQSVAAETGKTFYQGYYTNIESMIAEFNATDDAEAKFNQLIAVNEELKKIGTSVDLYAQLFDWLDKSYGSYYAAMGTLCTEEEVKEFEQNVYNPLIMALQDGTLTNEEVEAKIQDVKNLPVNQVAAPDSRWTFDNPDDLLATAEGDAPLQPVLLESGAGIVESIDAAGITAAMGPTVENGAAFLPKNAALYSSLGLTEQCNNYTLQFDIKVNDASNYNAIFQTDLTNGGDGDIFYSDYEIGVGDLGYSGTIKANTWQRIHCVNRAGEFTVYVDGERCNTANNSRWIINPEGILFFADNDGERVDTYVAEIAFWKTPLSDTQITVMSKVGDVATSIESVQQQTPAVRPALIGTFDLMGRKMNATKLPKGIYIHNGKKIVVK